jgi:hypothetical protein
MIRFLKEIYLTAFTIVFRLSRSRDVSYKAGGAVCVITLIEWFFLEGLRGYVDIILHKNIIFSKFQVIIAFLLLFFLNGYFLFFCGYGINFNKEFDTLKKSRKSFLVVSFLILSVAAVVFGICSAIAHRHFIGAD